jgi:isoleucyl-tRNA synthetase
MPTLAQDELSILDFWDKHHIFQKSLDHRRGQEAFIFNDGPPFATGLPHYGHLLASTIKDAVLRFKTMEGYFVPRRFGWDCHGLPVENEIEKEKGLSGAASIEEYGIAKFNEACRSIVLRYSSEWKKTIRRVGRWVDYDQNWHTMDPTFMESVWWTFKQLWDKGLVYEGFKVMPFSPALGTPLSNFEATSNYKEVDDPSIVIEFEFDTGERALVWTTTPWTLPANMALAVNPEISYALVTSEAHPKKKFLLAEGLVERHFGVGKKEDTPSYQIIKTLKGSALVGKTYTPLFPYCDFEKQSGAFRVIAADYVGEGDGTGIVHISPAHGEDDFYAAKAEGIPLVCAVDHSGHFTSLAPDYEGLFIKEADKPIMRSLKDRGLLFSQKTIHHRYPFCWRTDTPLIYKAHATWFVAVEKFKDKMLEANDAIHWTPGHIQKGRFGKWLEGARDWAVSRNRYWGTPLPIWKSEEGDIHVIGSLEELEKLSGQKVHDLHRHFVDQITFEKEGKTYRRITEVFDCWFESGSMPWAKRHYPFTSKEDQKAFLEHHPADFIAEGLDQTRGWFYTLTALSAALFDKPAFKNVIVNGIILAEDGNKMSKRLKNYPEPEKILEACGADSLRLYLLGSPAAHGDDMRFSQAGVETLMRQVLLPLSNALKFYTTYAEIYAVSNDQQEIANSEALAEIDRWAFSKVESLAAEVRLSFSKYELAPAVSALITFVEQLTNWYIRRSRSRFWADEDTQDRRSAFYTLHNVLLSVAKISAPFIPFLSEKIYLALKPSNSPLSVHLCNFPSSKEAIDSDLEEKMAAVQTLVGLGHSLRKELKIKVRQPLAKAWLSAPKSLKAYLDLIAEELNVKEVELADEGASFVTLSLEPNFRVLGKKVGPLMKEVKVTLAGLKDKIATEFAANPDPEKTLEIHVNGEKLVLEAEDIQVKTSSKGEHAAKAEGSLGVMLDSTLSEPLILEGYARELINKINTLRKEQGFEVTDRIEVSMNASDKIKLAFESHRNLIMHETLALDVRFVNAVEGTQWELGEGESVGLSLEKRDYETR